MLHQSRDRLSAAPSLPDPPPASAFRAPYRRTPLHLRRRTIKLTCRRGSVSCTSRKRNMRRRVRCSDGIRLMASMVTGRSLSPGKTGSRDCSRSQRGSFSRCLRHRQPRCGIRTARHHGGHEMRCYNQAAPILLRRRSARQKPVPPRPRRRRARPSSTATCPPRPTPSSTPSPFPRRTRRRCRVHVRLVLARRPLRGRTHPLRPRPRPVHEGDPRRQGQERPDRRRQARRPAPRRTVPDGLRLPARPSGRPATCCAAAASSSGSGPNSSPTSSTPTASTTCRPCRRSSPTPPTAPTRSPSASTTRARSSPSPPTWP